MGDLRVGDHVIGSDGRPTEVLAVYPQGVQPVWRIELSDGTFVRAGADHLWSVRTSKQKWEGGEFRTLTTREIADSVHRNWQLPMLAPAPQPDVELPMDPYTLGVILGDGSLAPEQGATLCTDHWIGETLGWACYRRHESCDYIGYYRGPASVRQCLRDLGLMGLRSHEKFVPAAFRCASPAQRLALLQGLMDTDGYAHPDGGAEFSSTSRTLVDVAADLVRSLGGVARGLREAAATYMHNGERKQGKPAWRINLKLPAGVGMFRLPRKAERYVEPTQYPPARIVRRVVQEGVSEEQVCIKVSAPDMLYVTRDYVLTHNSMALTQLACQAARRGKRVLYLSLELKPHAVAMRCLANLTGCTIHQAEANDPVFQAKVKKLHDEGFGISRYLRIAYLKPSEATPGMVRSICSKIASADGHLPQMIVVDYIDEMRGVEGDDEENTYQAFGKITGQLIEIGDDFRCPVWTATQIRRDGYGKDPALANIGESMKKVNKADLVAALCQTQDEREANPPQMRLKLLKVRRGDGRGKYVPMMADFARARLVEKPGGLGAEIDAPSRNGHANNNRVTP